MDKLHDNLQAASILCIFGACLLGDSYTTGGISFLIPAVMVIAAVITWALSNLAE